MYAAQLNLSRALSCLELLIFEFSPLSIKIVWEIT
jgi:hypothetical protein